MKSSLVDCAEQLTAYLAKPWRKHMKASESFSARVAFIVGYTAGLQQADREHDERSGEAGPFVPTALGEESCSP